MTIMVHGNLIGGRSKRQSLATLSSMEAELVELINGAQEAIWLRGLLEIDFLEPVGQLPVWKDNAACIAFSHAMAESFHRYWDKYGAQLKALKEIAGPGMSHGAGDNVFLP